MAALAAAEEDFDTALAAAKAAEAAGDEFSFATARQAAGEAYERVMGLSHDVASWASAHGA
jgi:hypothetical protein